jgi:hypothetical protein
VHCTRSAQNIPQSRVSRRESRAAGVVRSCKSPRTCLLLLDLRPKQCVTQAYLEESCVSKVQLVAKRSSAFVGDTVAAMTGTSPPSGAKAEFSDDFIDNDWCVWYCWMGCPSAVGQSFVPVAFFVAG